MRWSARALAGAIAAGVLAVALASEPTLAAPGATDPAEGKTTLERTIRDPDRDNRLQYTPGEDYVVRQGLAPAQPGREARRQQRIFYGQLTDLHQVDEESPARVEFLDRLGDPFTPAYRPQEGISSQVLEQMVREIRDARSPLTGGRLELVMTTGDNSDNSQRNETRWFIDILDGGVRVDPNSGVPGTCGLPRNRRLYDGVREASEYYEPDSSRPAPGEDTEDGPGYSPNQQENEREDGRTNQVRDFPGLFEDMNRRFDATGLREIPWFGIFGNHDSLIQGNQPRNPGFDAVATGCVKPKGLSADALGSVRELARGGLTPRESVQAQRVAADLQRTAADPEAAVAEGQGVVVPRDPDRHLLTKSEYIGEHFNTRGIPRGHGFSKKNVVTGQGNYVTRPKRGLTFVVLDSVADTGGSDGNIDDIQFRWLHQQLLAAETRRDLVMVFAHHSIRTMSQPPTSGFLLGDQCGLGAGCLSPLVHYGDNPPGAESDAPCAIQDPATPPTPDETLRCLLLRHRGVNAFVNGHEHNNRIEPFERRAVVGGPVEGGFWQVNTASHIDWAQQSRTIDLFDNRDGTLSIFGTIIDHASGPDPGGSDFVGPSSPAPSLLGSISRELAFNDPDARNGEDGRSDRRGERDDRNVELLVRNPYPAGGGPGGGRDDEDGRDRDRDARDRDARNRGDD
jgi:metallophosphoesterase (TIGR03767 family)